MKKIPNFSFRFQITLSTLDFLPPGIPDANRFSKEEKVICYGKGGSI